MSTTIAIGILLLFSFSLVTTPHSYSASGVSDKLYFHVDPNSSYTVGTINTGGATLNSTTLGFGSGNTKSASTTYSQNWYLSQLLAGGITVAGTPSMTLDLYASGNGPWNYTMQLVEDTSTGSTVSVLSSSNCSGASCLVLTTSQTAYSFTFSSISATVIPSGDLLQVSLIINRSAPHTVNFVTENNNPVLTSFVTLPLSVSPVVVNSFSVSPSQITNPGTSATTLSVSDAFGLYDLASQTVSATIPGITNQPISLGSMSASSSNSLTAYTGTFTSTINPGTTSFSSYSGTWNIQSTVTDNTGNSYLSNTPQLNYQASSGPSGTPTTTTSNDLGGGFILTPAQTYFVVGAIFLIVMIAVVLVLRRSH